MNALQHVMALDTETGEYRKSYMLRRLAQLFIMHDRGITQVEVSREMGLTKEAIRQYFIGIIWTGRPSNEFRAANSSLTGDDLKEAAERYREDNEDRVEQAIEKLSKQKRFLPPRIVGTPDENYLSETLFTRDLMKRPA